MKPAPFEYHAARAREEVFELLGQYGGEAKVLAGGQSLGPLLNLRLARPTALIDINPVSGLDAITVEDGWLEIGAMVRHRTVERSDDVRNRIPLLSEVMPWVGHPTIRNRGTLGGSLCHADPAAELPSVAVALGAEMVVQSKGGQRLIPALHFFTGIFSTQLQPDELLVATRWPQKWPRSGSAWIEFAPRQGDYALVGVAAVITLDVSGACLAAEIVCAGVAETPKPLQQAAAALAGKPLSDSAIASAAQLASAGLRPSSDLMASADYKRRLVRVLTQRALRIAYGRAKQEHQ